MRFTLVLIAGLLTWATPGTAQHRLAGPAPSPLFDYRSGRSVRPVPSAEPDDSTRRHPPTYWQEGAAVGGVLGLVGGALAGRRLCGLSEESTKHCIGSTVVGAVLGGALLAIPGALIGGQFSKKSAEPDPGA